MIKKILYLVWVSTLLFLPASHASERTGYFTMTIGQSVNEIDPFKVRSSTFKIGGGHQFSDYFSLEMFFTYYGKASDKVGAAELNQEGGSATVQAVGILPITNVVRLFAKAGVSKVKIKLKLDSPQVSGEVEIKGRDVIFGTGFLFDVDDDSTIRLEYEMFTYDDDSGSENEFSVINLGFQHYF